ncbi:uncharacterized protein G2W53_009651 [Senna tora]|uniref:Uncharacterized protein n=1 Tax=Senna tora TaxID=362788 RepID=A0A834WZ81_9FABA|nr:uncharacterized protein G2W53_009651 [Senna tora]
MRRRRNCSFISSTDIQVYAVFDGWTRNPRLGNLDLGIKMEFKRWCFLMTPDD